MGSYTSGATGGYNITILFKGTWTATMQGVFKESADRISRIIVGDIPSVRVNGRTVDDIQITAELASIDGAGGILGQAGPTALRSASYLPATGMMQFDSADADAYQGAGLFDDIVTHEMLHCIGFGSIWSYKGLVSGSSFIGANAMAAYDDLVDAFRGFENNVEALLVPLETGGGSGTAGSHWSEAVFGSELMTGYINTSAANGTETNPLSALTVAAMKDLGYVVSSAPPVDGYYLT